MTVRELGARMDSRELSQWEAFEAIEPFGDWRADLRAGIVAATVANSQRASSTSPVAKPEQFMPKFGPPPEPDPELETLALSSLIRSAGAEAEAAKRHP